MNMKREWTEFSQVVFLAAALAATASRGQTATQACSGYAAPGTITVVNTFTYPAGSTLVGLMWYPQVPDGWTVKNVRAPVGTVEMGWDGYIVWLGYTLPASPIVMLYDVEVPAGAAGPKSIVADVYYDLGPELIPIRATPDPLVLEDLNKQVQVVSLYGAPTPAVGAHTYLSGTVLNASVDASAYQGPTQYVCAGWSLTGHGASGGTGNSLSVTVTNDAVLTWNWSYYNTAPTVTGIVNMVGLRTKVSTIPESNLLSVATDADTGDSLALVAVQTNCASGATLVWAGGTIGYIPPETNRLGLTDLISYTVRDSKGAETTGTLQVKTRPVGVMIRVF